MVARAHQTMIWERSRQVLRLRAALREFFPAALEAFPDLDARMRSSCWPRRPTLTAPRGCPARTDRGGAAPGATPRTSPTGRSRSWTCCAPGSCASRAAVQAAYAAIVPRQVALIATLNDQIGTLGQVVADHFGQHPDAEIYLSQPGLGVILGARVLAEFGDDPRRFADAKARKNYAGTSPITRASGKQKVVLARYARNRRLADALHQWAFCAMRGSPGARDYYRPSAPAASDTKPPYGNSPTDSSESSTAA